MDKTLQAVRRVHGGEEAGKKDQGGQKIQGCASREEGREEEKGTSRRASLIDLNICYGEIRRNAPPHCAGRVYVQAACSAPQGEAQSNRAGAFGISRRGPAIGHKHEGSGELQEPLPSTRLVSQAPADEVPGL